MWNDYGDKKYGEDFETDLLGEDSCHNHHVDDDEDKDCKTDSQAHMVQCTGHPAAPLRCHLIAGVVGFTSRDGVDEGSNAEWQAAAHQGEDRVTYVVVDRLGQRTPSHVHRGLVYGDGGWMCWVLLTHGMRLLSVSFIPIRWWRYKALRLWRVSHAGLRRVPRVGAVMVGRRGHLAH